MSLRFIHVIRGVWISFLLKAELIFHCVCVSHLASFIQTISIDYLLIDTWVASIFWLLRILLLLPWLYNYLFKSLLSLLSDIYPRVGLLNHILRLIFSRNYHSVFHNGCTILHSHSTQMFQFLHLLTNTCYFLFFSFLFLSFWGRTCSIWRFPG